MPVTKAITLVLCLFAIALHAYAVDFICFEPHEDCKTTGPLLNVEWITAVRHVGSGQIEMWFDGFPGLPGSMQRSGVDWEQFLTHIIHKHDFTKFADFYVKERYLRRLACTDVMCELRIHPHPIRLAGDAADAIKAYLAQQVDAGRVLVLPSQ